MAGKAWAWAYKTAGNLVATKCVDLLVLPVGLPGAGKSTYIEHMGDITAGNAVVRGNVLVFDAMWLMARDRTAAVNLLKGAGISFAKAVYFDTPTDVCIARQELRGYDKQLPARLIRATARNLQMPTRAEGFDAIEVITNSGDPVISLGQGSQ
jgi:predicted kinase